MVRTHMSRKRPKKIMWVLKRVQMSHKSDVDFWQYVPGTWRHCL